MEFAKLFLRNLLEEISSTETETAIVTKTARATKTATETKILYFYADWCPYCNKIKSQMKQIKKDFNNKVINNNKMSIKFIDCGNQSKETGMLMFKFKIDRFPTLLIDKKNKPLVFSNNFSYNNVSTFINKEANFV